MNGGLKKDNWTVRDEFAAKAMQAIVPETTALDADKVAATSYRYADAMLAARC